MAKEINMPSDDDGEDIPFMQQLLDSPLILLAIGVAVPTLTYIIWGLVEIAMLPIAN